MRKGEIKLGQWIFKLGFIELGYAGHTYLMHFGIFKLTKFPMEGVVLQPEDYKGFWFRKEVRIKGFEITT